MRDFHMASPGKDRQRSFSRGQEKDRVGISYFQFDKVQNYG
jgi:hypothetical protein